jgi:hypothetical protein
MMAFSFDDHAAALAVLQLHKTMGENNAFWENIASGLLPCTLAAQITQGG